MRYMKGPDFPTGGIVTNKDELLYRFMKPAPEKSKSAEKWSLKKAKGGKTNVVITEIPYTMIGMNISKFLSDVAALSENKKDRRILWIFPISPPRRASGLSLNCSKDADAGKFCESSV